MLQELNTEAYKVFIEKFLDSDIRILALKKNQFKNIDFQLFIQQLQLLQKSKNKLPTYFNQRCFFTEKSLQQASSEIVALWKAKQITGDVMVDLSGGLGVDDWAFSASFTKIISADIDYLLNGLVRENYKKLNKQNIIRIDGSAEELLNQTDQCDCIYIDPDRRADSQKKVSAIEQIEPNLFQLIPEIFNKTRMVVVKLSPLFDVNELLRLFDSISEVWCIAHQNEMKEVTIVLKKDNLKKTIIKAINIKDSNFDFFQSDINNKIVPSPKIYFNTKYFYEPNHALIHSGLWKAYAEQEKLSMIHSSIPYLFSDIELPNFQGRKFKIIHIIPYKVDVIKKYLSVNQISKVNISRRNFPLSPDELFLKLKIKPGGDDYLFFAESAKSELYCFHCIK